MGEGEICVSKREGEICVSKRGEICVSKQGVLKFVFRKMGG